MSATTLSPQDSETINVRTRRQSVRSRRSQVSEKHDVDATSPMKDPAPRTRLQERPSKMSLFSLFSKPKVEKARGYAEPGLGPSLNLKHANASKATFFARSDQDDVVSELQPRTASAMSFRQHMSRPASRATSKPPMAMAMAPSRKGVPFEAPPLFQAYPQAVKTGSLQVSMMTAETVLQKSKSRKAGGQAYEPTPRGSVDDNRSVDTRRTAKTTFRHVTTGSFSNPDLPKKILVLLTSGYLLQYAESGPSNRLPERVLQLGKESAAFACDLIPGKHYVLQISQAVDQQGVLITNSSSLLSKFGIRNATARRTTANLLLVMPNAAEMDGWMTAIREEIEILGGSKARADTFLRPERRSSIDELDRLEQSPSRSHQYQVRREPSKISLVSKPSAEANDALASPRRAMEEDERSEAGTIEDIEEEADQLAEDARGSPAKVSRELDAQSLRSSIATSMDQQRLNSLRSSQRISHSTVATTVGTSRTNSLCGSPMTEDVAKASSDSSIESTESRSQYRTLSSYVGAVARRRSAMPLASKAEQPLPTLNLHAPMHLHSAMESDTDSPVVGRNVPLPSMSSPRKLNVAASEPNLRAMSDARMKHDSHMPTPPLLPEEDERPLSVVGDLPSAMTRAPERSPNRRMPSLMQVTNAQTAPARGMPRSPRFDPIKRKPSPQSFSLPLRINPSTPENRPPTRQENRGSFNRIEEGTGEPVVHTLTAKVDSSQATGAPAQANPQSNPTRTASGRLSLFPSPPTQTPSVMDPLTPSLAGVAQAPPPQSSTLKRPTSMQVRSDPAPFLRGVRIRTSTYGTPGPPSSRSFTAPIRSLKPSRSSTHIAARPRAPASPTDPFSVSAATFDFPEAPEEAADKPMPLPGRTLSPSPMRPPSRNTSGRKLKTRASLPELDLGIPVVGLGPPAPPPSAPLPPPPPGSRPTSPLPNPTGLGIRV